jgi:hypothetical protein
MPSSGMLLRVAVVRTDVSQELSAFFIRVTGIGELGISSQRASVASYNNLCFQLTDSCHSDGGSARFLRNVGSYKSHKA